MKSNSNQSFYPSPNFLFTQKLNFLSSHSQVKANIQFANLTNQKINLLNPDTSSIVSINQVNHYRSMNQLVLNCRYNTKNIELTFNKSKKQLGKKTQLQYSLSKQFKTLDITPFVLLSHQTNKYWKKIFNHVNMKQHIKKAIQISNAILEAKSASVVPYTIEQQIVHCMQMIDLNTLISNLRVNFSTPQLYMKIMNQEFKNTVSISDYLKQIENLVSQLEQNKQTMYGLWLNAAQIGFKTLKNEEGVYIHFEKVQMLELISEWQILYNIYYGENKKQLESISFESIFESYLPLFSFYLNSSPKNDVLILVNLIKNIWMKIDEKSSKKIMFKILVITSQCHKTLQLTNQIKQFFIDVTNLQIEQHLTKRKAFYLQRLHKELLNIHKDLVLMKNNFNFVQDYFLVRVKTVKQCINQFYTEFGRFTNFITLDNFGLETIKTINQNMKAEIKNVSQIQNYQVLAEWLLNQCPNQKYLINQLINLIIINQILYKTVLSSKDEFQLSFNYYHIKLTSIMDQAYQLKLDEVSKLPFGAVDAVKILTFCLILNFKQKRLSSSAEESLKERLSQLLLVINWKKDLNTLQDHQTDDDQNSQFGDFEHSFQHFEELIQNKPDIFCSLTDTQYKQAVKLKKTIKKSMFSLVQCLCRLGTNIYEQNIKQQSLRQKEAIQSYKNCKKYAYKAILDEFQNNKLNKQIQKIPALEHHIIQGRDRQVWKELREFQHLEELKLKLQQFSNQNSLMIRIYISILQKYKSNEMTEKLYDDFVDQQDITRLLTEIESEFKEELVDQILNSELKQKLTQAIVCLDQNQKLIHQRQARKQKKSSANGFLYLNDLRRLKEPTRFAELQNHLKIYSITNRTTQVSKQFEVTLQSRQEFNKLYSQLTLYKQFTQGLSIRSINLETLTINLEQNIIERKFNKLPDLIRHLVTDYYEVIDFCSKTLRTQFYPLLSSKNMLITKKDTKYVLRITYTESIIFNLLIGDKLINVFKYFQYPKYPFFHFSEEIYSPIIQLYHSKYQNYIQANKSSEFVEFNHFIQQIKALELEDDIYNFANIHNKIHKIPYLWIPSVRFQQIIDFKQAYWSNINIEQCRRKQNYKKKEQMSQFELHNFDATLSDKDRHEDYKIAHGFHKTTQMYFSIEGVLQKQAFLQNIGNFDSLNRIFGYNKYFWYEDKHIIRSILKQVAEQSQKKRGVVRTVDDQTFPSFQNQIRLLRNMLVHSVSFEEGVCLNLEQKLSIIEEYFPKLFTFIYRWKPFCGKDFKRHIQTEKVSLLKAVFKKQDNSDVIRTLESSNHFHDYSFTSNYQNPKEVLLKMFNYDWKKNYDCTPCRVLCNAMQNTRTFWKFMENIKDESVKFDRDNSFNLLFWEHKKNGCNCAHNLQQAFKSVLNRDMMTTEERSFMSDSAYQPGTTQKRTNQKQSQFDNQQLQDQFFSTDYVYKGFIFQLQTKFPLLFHDLRRYRYVWDAKLRDVPQ